MNSMTSQRAAAQSPVAAPSERAHTRAILAIALITISCAALLADLLLVGHTSGEELWGPVTAASGTLVGVLTLAYIVRGGRGRLARIALYGLWLMVAFFGFGGYNDHRLAVPPDVNDSRSRPPLAPLVFTGLGLAGALILRYDSKEH